MATYDTWGRSSVPRWGTSWLTSWTREVTVGSTGGAGRGARGAGARKRDEEQWRARARAEQERFNEAVRLRALQEAREQEAKPPPAAKAPADRRSKRSEAPAVEAAKTIARAVADAIKPPTPRAKKATPGTAAIPATAAATPQPPTATPEERIAAAIERGMAKILEMQRDEKTAKEQMQAEEERELKLLRQLGFLGKDDG